MGILKFGLVAGVPFNEAWPMMLMVWGFTALVMSFAGAWYLIGWLLTLWDRWWERKSSTPWPDDPELSVVAKKSKPLKRKFPPV